MTCPFCQSADPVILTHGVRLRCFDCGASWEVRKPRASAALEKALLRADASATMMHAVIGMGTNEFAAARRAMGLQGRFRGGRPVDLTDQQSRILHNFWQPRHDAGSVLFENPADWLVAATITGAPLRSIWMQIRAFGRGTRTVRTPTRVLAATEVRV